MNEKNSLFNKLTNTHILLILDKIKINKEEQKYIFLKINSIQKLYLYNNLYNKFYNKEKENEKSDKKIKM